MINKEIECRCIRCRVSVRDLLASVRPPEDANLDLHVLARLVVDDLKTYQSLAGVRDGRDRRKSRQK